MAVRALLVCNGPGCDPTASLESREPEQAVFGPVHGPDADRIRELAAAEEWTRVGAADYCPRCSKRAGVIR